MQRWEKRGLLFRPDPARAWQRSHAAMPSALALGGDAHRVYFASRDAAQRSHIGWFDLDVRTLTVLDRCAAPALSPGALGHFDGQGVFPSAAVRAGDRVLLYTVGWTRGDPAPLFYPAIGLAVSGDGGRTFERHGRAPVLDRSEHDPWMVSGPHVLAEGGALRMWYLSGQGWDTVDGALRSRYDVKHATSADGVAWRRDGRTCLPNRLPRERAIARLWVLPEDGRYRGWYASDRGDGYRLGYAESADGLDWERRDGDALLPPDPDGWDAAVAYPCVLRDGDRLVLLYNGAAFGRDGIGVAVCAA